MPFMRCEGKHDLTNEEYHSDKHYFSSSQLKYALQSPAHFRFHVVDKRGKQKKTKALDLGTLTHTILLEPYKFDEEYIIYDGEINADGSIPKKVVTQYRSSHPGKMVISKESYDFACNARKNVEAYPFANDLFYGEGCEYESSFFHHDKETGLRLRIRPDILNLEKGYIVDLKTAIDSDKFNFKRAVSYKWDYDMSAYMYQKVIYDLYGVNCKYYWGVVGKEDMAPVAIYTQSNDLLLDGKAKFYKAADNIKTALVLDDQYRFQDEPEEI